MSESRNNQKKDEAAPNFCRRAYPRVEGRPGPFGGKRYKTPGTGRTRQGGDAHYATGRSVGRRTS